MKMPINIAFKDVPKSDAIQRLIMTKIAGLEKECNYITSCRVSLEKTQKHHKTGNPIQICIDLHIPQGHNIVVKESYNSMHGKDVVSAMIRNAFEKARRKIRKVVERQHGESKAITNSIRFLPEEQPEWLNTADIFDR
jgi:ribosome-associated translation inhibitor RaiA